MNRAGAFAVASAATVAVTVAVATVAQWRL